MLLRKIINIKENFRFTMRTQIYVIFGCAQKKIVLFTKRKSVIHDFRERSCEIAKLFSFYLILGLHGAFRNVTPRITEKGRY